MKKLCTKLFFCLAVLFSVNAQAGNFWHQVDAGRAPKNIQWQHPEHFLVFTMDEATLKLLMWNLSEDPNEGMIVALPMPDGSFRDFKVWQTPMMPGSLAQKYPDIRTFTGEALDDRMVTAKLDFTCYGFSAMIYDGENTSFIDPYDNYHDGFYMVHYKRDETKPVHQRMECMVKDNDDQEAGGTPMITAGTKLPAMAAKTVNGHTLRTYRLALCANNYYCQAATGLSAPTIAQAFAKMTTTMNRVNGVYNREFAVQMNFIANEDTLIWTQPTGTINGADPFHADNANGANCLGINRTTCQNRIGNTNFDCGHVFTTGGGGISGLGIVCNNTSGQHKARSVTGLPSPVGDGFDIDYVAHEMGHQFGSNHTFNNNADGSCSGNASNNYAYEPGSGSTILAYAGICAADNIQPHSDAYFHASSLVQIQSKLAGSQDVCAAKTTTTNKLVYIDPFSASYKIPYKTPFELIAPTAIDSASDTVISYCWEQWNRGDFGNKLQQTFFRGPIFRSFNPRSYDPIRIFPKLSMVLSGNLVSVTTSGNMGEKAPDTTRFLTFKLTLRNMHTGYGSFLFPDDTIHVDAISTGAANGYSGFKVTSQNVFSISYTGGSAETITWDVAGTDAAPVSCANVKIFMSTDGGNTWPYTVGTFPNNGSAAITVPNPPATSNIVRFKVKGDGNIFFNVNLKNITVTHNPSASSGVAPAAASLSGAVRVFPVPARDLLHISIQYTGTVTAAIYNATGQLVWTGIAGTNTEIAVGTWARGVYHVRFADVTNGQMTAKTIILE
jgi:hypothetical protein